jgi:hypothetical protein
MKMAEIICPENIPFFKEWVNGKNAILLSDTSIHDGYPMHALIAGNDSGVSQVLV